MRPTSLPTPTMDDPPSSPSVKCDMGMPTGNTDLSLSPVNMDDASPSSPSAVSTLHLSTASTLVLPSLPPTDAVEYHNRCRPFAQTNRFILQKGDKTFMMSDRGARGGYVPMSPTDRPLYHRRYTIDVNTCGWSKQFSRLRFEWAALLEDDCSMPSVPAVEFVLFPGKWVELEPPAFREPILSLPNPCRFQELAQANFSPPIDEEIYLQLDESSLQNDEFHMIVDLQSCSWFRDNILNVALEMLSNQFSCKARRIEIANSMVSQILFRVGYGGDVDNNNFVHYAEEKRRFEDKDWIFFPINDGFASDDSTQVCGSHWSLVAINRPDGLAHYIDSMSNEGNNKQALIGACVAEGLGNILEERYALYIEEYAPDQYADNQCKSDLGPCGPFVVVMIFKYLNLITEHQDEGTEEYIDLSIPESFVSEAWLFNSQRVRLHIREMIAEEQCRQETRRTAAEHDLVALEE
ncbi:cysteine proteinase [Lindgomyces ingoldianus]|uniref:Cysteine proteinase n=1 Tax=Lindgomyces ingoldianus TaxID=673940 RepID=A0ACB6RE22_9PLEO|nr:cysteine proteinase [Lindgomyces ingoldianus]KAF2476965.1 cysteine proteinase [Lindgomyces ingoldianus]